MQSSPWCRNYPVVQSRVLPFVSPSSCQRHRASAENLDPSGNSDQYSRLSLHSLAMIGLKSTLNVNHLLETPWDEAYV